MARRRAIPASLITLLTLGALLLAWQLVASSGRVPAYFVPSPAATWRAFTDIVSNGYRGHTLFEHLGASLYRVLLAFAGSAVIGVPLGLGIGSSRRIAAIVNPLIEFYRPLPPLAYYTLLVIWLGIGDASKIALLLLAGLPPVVIATASAVRDVRGDYVQGARSLGASRAQVFRYVIFPSALPGIFTGLRVSIGFTYTTLVAAEMVAGLNGVGWMVLDASKFLQSDVIFVGIFLMGATGIALDAALRVAERVMVPWRGKATLWFAMLLATMTLTACGSQPANTEGGASRPARLRIGYQAIPNAELMAKQLKWHEQTLGIPIEWRQFESGRDVNTAIAAGSIDIGLSGSGGAATALAQGLPLSVIAIYDVIGRSEALAVRGSIRGLTDLRGKRLAAPFASTTHYSLLKLLELNGIGANEVTLLDLNPSDTTAAWIRGDIDGAYIWQPTLQRLLDAGGTRLMSSDEMAARGVPTFDVAVASDALMAAHPQAIVSYLKTLTRAVQLYRSDRQQALDALARELGVSADQARLQAEGLLWLTSEEQLGAKYFGTDGASGGASAGGLATALKATADFLVAQKVIRTAPELTTFQQRTDGQFLRRAAAKE